MEITAMKRILMTGAAGGVGGMLRPLLRKTYPDMRLSDRITPAALGANEPFMAADLTNMSEVEKVCEGIDGILHFGGYSIEGTWEQIHEANIVGCYNLFEAARRQGVKRVVFASSNHAVGYYPRTTHIGPDVVPRPDSRYGISKVFGEAVGAMYADKHGMSVTSLRIGNVGPLPLDKRRLAIWLHPEDLAQLCRIGLEHPVIRYEVFYGMSLNERAWWDNTNAYEHGYRPKHRAEDHAAHALAEQLKAPADPIGDHYQGGTFCSAEFTAPKPDLWS
jgi:uronate dehydrogenase